MGAGGGACIGASTNRGELDHPLHPSASASLRPLLRVAQQLRQKSHGNAAALRALQSLEAARPAHQRCDVRANRQWVNMGELFVKLPQRNLERTIAKDQSTIEATIGQLEESEARLRGRLARAGPT